MATPSTKSNSTAVDAEAASGFSDTASTLPAGDHADSPVEVGGGEIASADAPSHHKYDQIVRCGDGHLYTTIWVPMVSFKALRFGSQRYQWCPVGHHFSLIGKAQIGELTMEEMEEASRIHDISIW
ncbi:hypothetical protein BX600DRAFT_54557 [Xylariales sp. PMI_506]|nr:hypothetical protein BX600DRAFT_54557 [Xylariales sp. PMI_506]